MTTRPDPVATAPGSEFVLAAGVVQAARYRGSANSEPGAVATGSTGLTEQDQCYLLTRQNSTVNDNAT